MFFLWIPLDMMGQVQKMMKYQEDKKHVFFLEPCFCYKTPASFPYNFAGPRFSWYIYIYICGLNDQLM